MTTTLVFLMLLVVITMFILWMQTMRSLYEEQSRTAILTEREKTASRILFGCYRKLAVDTEDTYINKNEVLLPLITVLQIYGADPPTVKISTDSVPASREATGAAQSED